MWNQETGAKLLAYKAFSGKITECDEISKLHDLIKTDLNLATNPIIAPPSPKLTGEGKEVGPFCALVKGILPKKAVEFVE
jgi:hypothetical protein